MRKTTVIICVCFLAVFAAAALLPFAGMIFGTGDSGAAEQRDPSPFPAIVSDGNLNLNFGNEFEDWFRDRFAFRTLLVNANAKAMLGLFNTSPEDDVIAGKEGWLFYADTAADYCREERLTDNELARLATSIRLESDYAKSLGAVYVFAAAPNKNSVYPEMMSPVFTQNSGESLLDRLNAALADEGVTVCDLKKDLIAEKSTGQLYYKGDSHWNLLGSTVVWKSLTDRASLETGKTFLPSTRNPGTLSGGVREDDLLKMVLPLEANTYEEYSADSSEAKYTVKGRMGSLDDAVIETVSGGTDLRLLMFRDSFGRAMIHPLANSFAEAVFVRSAPFDLYGRLGGYDGDLRTVVVREIVERNLTKLLETAPLVPAREITGEEEIKALSSMKSYSAGEFTVEKTAERGDNCLHCGTVADGGDGYDRVFVRIGGSYYEAFPFCDSASDLRGTSGCGFSFYLPKNADAEVAEVIISGK